MDIKAQYLQAMRSQAPALFKRMSKAGELEKAATDLSRQAEQMFRQLTADKPKPLSLRDRREAEEQVRAALLQFPNEETTMQQDERRALRGDRPILSAERTSP